jgi:putative ABC transport system ATP-binding protein
MPTGPNVISVRDLVKDYDGRRALDGVSLDVPAGRFVAVMGPSGSGKSTLLHLMGGLDTPTAGEIELDGTPLGSLSDDKLTLLRRNRIGFVFQFFNLVPVLSIEENVALPAVIAGIDPGKYQPRLEQLLTLVGLDDHRGNLPSKVSGGQQQRAAIARALLLEPAVVLADEPTGNLDSVTGRSVLQLLRDAQKTLGQTVVLVTHDPNAAAIADEVVFLRDGRIEGRHRLVGSEARRARNIVSWLQAA